MRSEEVERSVALIGGPAPKAGLVTMDITIRAHRQFEIWPNTILIPNYDDGDRAFAVYKLTGRGSYVFSGYSAWQRDAIGRGSTWTPTPVRIQRKAERDG